MWLDSITASTSVAAMVAAAVAIWYSRQDRSGDKMDKVESRVRDLELAMERRVTRDELDYRDDDYGRSITSLGSQVSRLNTAIRVEAARRTKR